MGQQWCDALLGVICSTPTDTLPFWEVTASAIVTGAVTALTIWASIRGARRETQRNILASLRTERRARAERERESARLTAEEAARQRAVLAAALSQGAHRMQRVVELPEEDRIRLEAEAQWSALRISFTVSSAPHAADLYDFADLLVKRSRNASLPKDRQIDSLFEYAKHRMYAQELDEAASYWARNAALDDQANSQLADLRLKQEEDRKKTTQELLSGLRKYQPPPSEPDNDTPGSP